MRTKDMLAGRRTRGGVGGGRPCRKPPSPPRLFRLRGTGPPSHLCLRIVTQPPSNIFPRPPGTPPADRGAFFSRADRGRSLRNGGAPTWSTTRLPVCPLPFLRVTPPFPGKCHRLSTRRGAWREGSWTTRGVPDQACSPTSFPIPPARRGKKQCGASGLAGLGPKVSPRGAARGPSPMPSAPRAHRAFPSPTRTGDSTKFCRRDVAGGRKVLSYAF